MSRAMKARGRLGLKSRQHPQDHPEVIQAKADLAEAKLADYIERTLAKAPQLTDQQRTALAELLKPVRINTGHDVSLPQESHADIGLTDVNVTAGGDV